ncbi:hypothetical protein PRIPAC_97239 [Pristionchus pacificus]|uniref:Uncharacterized protein n=1 Tax=Pristionchus pacificus TaxID=54126 RepID=A0A2A6BXP5_PRIPA|nr:hypothetical protein PRIPAC_97239 [Pristionchus pacificus]|eukprot:PDM70680.1 hypothetical protein PRIPAC_43885 [Pristionchus pacificus]
MSFRAYSADFLSDPHKETKNFKSIENVYHILVFGQNSSEEIYEFEVPDELAGLIIGIRGRTIKVSSTAVPPFHPNINDLVLNEKALRAVIVEILEGKSEVIVCYSDYGFFDRVQRSQLRKMNK